MIAAIYLILFYLFFLGLFKFLLLFGLGFAGVLSIILITEYIEDLPEKLTIKFNLSKRKQKLLKIIAAFTIFVVVLIITILFGGIANWIL